MKTNNWLKYVLLVFIIAFFGFNNTNAQRIRHKKETEVAVVKKSQKKYKHLPHYRKVVSKAPKSHKVIVVSNKKYLYDGAVFYKSHNNGYIVCTAPIGARIKVLPVNYSRIVFRGKTFYYHFGIFYQEEKSSDEYVVVSAPLGSRVDAIPEGYEIKRINGTDYYFVGEVYYKLVADEYGQPLFEVVKLN